MPDKPSVCGGLHRCYSCGMELPACQLPSWACPWVNGDEDQMCEPCTERTAIEYAEAMGYTSNKEES